MHSQTQKYQGKMGPNIAARETAGIIISWVIWKGEFVWIFTWQTLLQQFTIRHQPNVLFFSQTADNCASASTQVCETIKNNMNPMSIEHNTEL